MTENAASYHVLTYRRLGIIGGVFYLLVGGSVLFFVGRYISWGSPGPPWVLAMGLLSGGAGLAMGVWMIRVGLRGASKRSEAWLRHLVSGAVAALLLWAPLDALDVVQGPTEFIISAAAFFLIESLLKRWIVRTMPRQVEAGATKVTRGRGNDTRGVGEATSGVVDGPTDS